MVEQVTFQTIFQFLQTVGILVGVFYYIMTIRANLKNQQMQLETRQTQIFMQVYQQLNSEESYKTFMDLLTIEIKDFDEYLKKYDSSINPAHYAKRAYFWYNFNTIGELLRMGMIELDLLTRLQLDIRVILLWEKWEHIIKENRRRENLPDIWKGFEYLYNEMKKFRDTKGYPDMKLTQPPIT